MMKSAIIAGLILLGPVLLFGQSNTEDVVYLKDGGVLRGSILELNEGEFLKIETIGRNVFVVMMDEVEEIASEKIPDQTHYKESGYINRTGFEVLRAKENSTIRLYTVNGVQLTSRFAAGVGIGLTPYDDPLTLLPFFLDLNYRLHKSNVSPYLFLKAGYNFSIYHDDEAELDRHSGGLIFNPGAGVQVNLGSGFGWYINAGYNIDNSYYEFDTWGSETVENDLSFRRINFGLGLSF